MSPIRQATSDDIDQLLRLRLLLFQETGEASRQAPGEAVREATRAYLTTSLDQETFLAWVAVSGPYIVATSGIVLFERPPAPDNLSGKEAYILNMYTLPEWRGQGLATALLQEITSFAKSTSIRRLWLHATASGRPIYEKAGFVTTLAEMELTW
jgi:GNAT superfamily N-acetyltransferase